MSAFRKLGVQCLIGHNDYEFKDAQLSRVRGCQLSYNMCRENWSNTIAWREYWIQASVLVKSGNSIL